METLQLLSISSTGAVLGANVNANGVLSRFWFEWGPTTSLGSTSAVKILFASATTFTTNLPVSGFQRDTEYYYKVVATNALGYSAGSIQTFKWVSTPPADLAFFKDVDGASQIEFEGEAFHSHVVQGSSNLVDWIDLGPASTNLTQSTTSFLFRHSQTVPAASQFFYRIRLP